MCCISPGYAAGVADDVDDEDRIVGILASGNATYTGAQLLDMLHDAGYRVVREAMVPQFEDLDVVAEVLAELGSHHGRVQHNYQDAAAASTTIRQLRELACLVLRVDPDG